MCGTDAIGMFRNSDIMRLTDEALHKLRAVKYEEEDSEVHEHDDVARLLLKVLERKTKDDPDLGE